MSDPEIIEKCCGNCKFFLPKPSGSKPKINCIWSLSLPNSVTIEKFEKILVKKDDGKYCPQFQATE